MKTTIFYTVAFLPFCWQILQWQCQNYFICELLRYREYGQISQPQGAHTRS